ncbi:MAG: ABC transporter permease [Alistipes sp.]|nr:ABC transporter permease [Alistipes sp.]
MKHKKIITAVIAAANVLSAAAWGIMTAVGSSAAKEQGYNSAAIRWDSSGESVQASCFLTEDSGFTVNETAGVKASLMNALKNISVTAEEGQQLIADAYSTSGGQMSFRGDGMGRTDAEVTVFGGDFFLFRDLELINGSYISDSDLMQDGVVIDRTAAWALYGSEDVAGMNVYINGTKFYISGVVENPDSKAEKKTAGDTPRAYMTYDGYKLVSGEAMYDGDAGYSQSAEKVSCYECVIPSPVENFGYNAFKDYFSEGYKETSYTVNNTLRFAPKTRAKKYKKLSEYAVHDKPIVYPWWENASRITEFRLSRLYHFRRLAYIIPAITLAILIVLLWRMIGILRKRAADSMVESVKWGFYNRKQKKLNNTGKEETDTEKDQNKKKEESL